MLTSSKTLEMIPVTVIAVNRAGKEEYTRSYSPRSCYRCGKGNHSPAVCHFKDAKCHECGKKGHIASVCRSKRTPVPPARKEQYVTAADSDTDDDLPIKLIGSRQLPSRPITPSTGNS